MSLTWRQEGRKGGGYTVVVYWDNGRGGMTNKLLVNVEGGISPFVSIKNIDLPSQSIGFYNDERKVIQEIFAFIDKNNSKLIEEREHRRVTSTERNPHGYAVEMSNSEAIAYLKSAKIDIVQVPTSRGMGEYNQPLIEYRGKWLRLCRTSLVDDVATGLCETMTAEEWRKYYLKHIRYGVRISDTSWACIDAYSDG